MEAAALSVLPQMGHEYPRCQRGRDGGTGLEVQSLTSDVTRQEGRPAWGCVVLPHGAGEGEADLRHMKRVFI